MYLATKNTNRKQVSILDTVNFEVVSTLPKFENDVICTHFAPWDENMFAVSVNNQVQLWNIANGALRGVLEHDKRVYAMAFGKRHDSEFVNEFLVTRCLTMCVRSWNLATNEQLFSVSVPCYCDLYVCCHGHLIIAPAENRKVYVWNSDSGETRNELESSIEGTLEEANIDVGTTRIQGCQGNDKLMSIASKKRMLTVMTLDAHENHMSLSKFWESPAGTDITYNYVLSGDGSRLVCWDFISNSVFVVDVESMTLISQFKYELDHSVDPGNDFRVSFDGNQLCYCVGDRYIFENGEWRCEWNVLDVETKTVTHTLRDVSVAVYSCAVNVILM